MPVLWSKVRATWESTSYRCRVHPMDVNVLASINIVSLLKLYRSKKAFS